MSHTSNSTTDGDAPCSSCQDMVTRTDDALECDICEGWFHLECSGVSKKCYELILDCEGLPWMCKSCKVSLRSLSSSLHALEADNAALRQQILEIHQEVLSTDDSRSPRTQQLDVTVTQSSTPMSKSVSLPLLHPSSSLTHSHAPSSTPAPTSSSPPGNEEGWTVVSHKRVNKNNTNKSNSTHNQHPSSDSPEIKFICKIDRDSSNDNIVSSLSSARISTRGCHIEQITPQDQFSGRFKFVRIILPNQSRADEFANGLKNQQNLKWKLSRIQPLPPKRSTSTSGINTNGQGFHHQVHSNRGDSLLGDALCTPLPPSPFPPPPPF